MRLNRQVVETTPQKMRLGYIDGFRALAVSLVIVHHAYEDLRHSGDDLLRSNSVLLRLIGWIGAHGYLGVQLFFVLSGFCLAYPPLQRRAEGKTNWFVPSQFFARRTLRILPPYYVALAFFVLVNMGLAAVHLNRLVRPISPLDLLTHIALVHNLTQFNMSIVGPFWTLGLEWQWYFVFPPLLLLCIWRPHVGVLACVAMTIAWHFGVAHLGHDLRYLETMSLPGTLSMFCWGIIVAQWYVARRGLPSWILLAAAVLCVTLDEYPATQRVIGDVGLYESLYALAFASLVLMATRSRLTQSILSWRPLVSLGIASYSVYLVHQPFMASFSIYATKYFHSALIMVPAIAIGLISGAVFHLLIERPCMRRETWARYSPYLIRLFTWTDPPFKRQQLAQSPVTDAPARPQPEPIP